MKRFKTSSKSSSSKKKTTVKNDVFLKRTIQDEFGNKNTVILKWGNGKGDFLKQEIKHGN